MFFMQVRKKSYYCRKSANKRQMQIKYYFYNIQPK